MIETLFRARGARAAVGGTLALCLASSLAAQSTRNAILETPTARVELIGLKRWTLAMIQDSLARYAPGESLASHACAAILREKLGFADAAAQYTPPSGANARGYWAVPVVEPQDSSRVRYRELPRDSLPDRPEWAAALAVVRDHNQVFQSAIQTPPFLLGRMHPDSVEPRLAPSRPLLQFLRTHRAEADRRVALWTLDHDRNARHRALAAVVIAGFAGADTTWWALVDALRDQDAMVAATASQVLSTLSRSAARLVNWAPVTDRVRAVLDGTNLFAHNILLEALTVTRVDTVLASALLRGGGELVVAKLRSQDVRSARVARQFLTQVGGRDLGQDAAAWERWIRSR